MSLGLLSRAATSVCLTAAVLALVGCAITFDARSLGANVTVATAPGGTPCTAEFRRSQKAVFLLWGIVPASRPSLERTVAGHVTGSQGVTDLRIKVSSRFTDLLVTALTAGLVVPRTVTFQGCVIGQ